MSEFRCQNCEHTGDEDDFTPSDGNPTPHVCPKCGSTDCFPADDASTIQEPSQDLSNAWRAFHNKD